MDGYISECGYKEYDRELMEKFINGLDDEGMISEMLMDV